MKATEMLNWNMCVQYDGTISNTGIVRWQDLFSQSAGGALHDTW